MTDAELTALAEIFRDGHPAKVLATARRHGPALVEAVLNARRFLSLLKAQEQE